MKAWDADVMCLYVILATLGQAWKADLMLVHTSKQVLTSVRIGIECEMEHIKAIRKSRGVGGMGGGLAFTFPASQMTNRLVLCSSSAPPFLEKNLSKLGRHGSAWPHALSALS